MKKIDFSSKLSFIVSDYNSGLSVEQVAKKHKHGIRTILNLFKINNIPLRSHSDRMRKHKIEEHFFDIIDTEEKAYFLGLLYADGCNHSNKNHCSLSLIEKDKDILLKFTELLQPSKPLQFKRGKDNHQNSYRMDLYSKQISNRLSELGCGSRKTFTLKFPTIEQVPVFLQKHFIRGYFDGDGSINNGAKHHFSFVGTKDFINGLQEVLLRELSFNITKTSIRHPERNYNIVTLLKCGRIQCLKFGKWLYEDSTIYLQRKKEVFNKYRKESDL